MEEIPQEQDGDYDKAIGSYRLKLNGMLKPLRLYGQGAYIDSLLEELVSLGVQLHLRLSGVDIPYTVEDIHW